MTAIENRRIKTAWLTARNLLDLNVARLAQATTGAAAKIMIWVTDGLAQSPTSI